MGEEITLIEIATEQSVKPAQIKSILDLPVTTAGKTVLTEDQIDTVRTADFAAPVAPIAPVVAPVVVEAPVTAPAAPVDETVIFFWREGKNTTFNVKDGTSFTTNKLNQQIEVGTLYKTTKSVIRLSTEADGAAIDYLRKHKKNEANGGRLFGEMQTGSVADSDKGTAMDKLMLMDIKSLAQMAGGTIADERKSKGTLITEILEG